MPQPQRILVVEDEPLIAMMLEDFLDALGKHPVGAADTVATALAACADGAIDGAIVDVHLRDGETSWPVADALDAAGVPFLFVTGGSDDSIIDRHRHRPVLIKPFTMESVEQALAAL